MLFLNYSRLELDGTRFIRATLDSYSSEEIALQQYRRRQKTTVIAIPLDLDTDGLTYRKWGATQRAKRGDWLVNNGEDVYTIDADTFARTYRESSRGMYEKTTDVWARKTNEAGTIVTKEGSTDYEAGDYLVFNDPEERDGYAMKAEKFDSLYEPTN
jgi:hypothetical protein